MKRKMEAGAVSGLEFRVQGLGLLGRNEGIDPYSSPYAVPNDMIIWISLSIP